MTSIDFAAGNYRYVPSVFQYSAGAAALPGYHVQRVMFRSPVPLKQGFERIAGITGGNIFHGELLLHQLFFLRPAPQWADFRTPLPGYYFGAAGAHPGGGVMGAAGKMAATEILRDW